VLDELRAAVERFGAEVIGECDSGLPGPKGNREFFLLLRDDGHDARR
jgi:hypothetical protein